MNEINGALSGLKIVACSTAQAGTVPYMLMADLGAEVIKNTVFTAYKSSVYKHVVPGAGVEPAPLESDKILSLACLPISPPGQ